MAPSAPPAVDALIRSGRFAEAGAALSSCDDAAGLIERARLACLAGDFEEAARVADGAVAARDASDGTRLLARALRSCGLAALGRPNQPLRVDDVDPRLPQAASIAYYAALPLYWTRDYDGAARWIAAFSPRDVPLRARYLLLQGLLAAAAGRMKAQLDCAQKALDLLETGAPEETYLIAFCAHIVALLLRELSQRGALRRLAGLEKRLTWSDGLQSMHVQVLRTIGWTYALDSEFVSALTYITRAALALDDPIVRAYAHLDRATVGIFAGERTGARADFAIAEGIAKTIDWKGLRTEGLAVLTLAASTAAELQQTQAARAFCTLAESTQGQMSPYWALAHGPRMDGFLAEARALTDAGHQHKAAIESARRGYAIFDEIGYRWRAGRMATLLHALTGEEAWRERAEAALASYARSPFAAILRESTQRDLTVRQQEVLRLTLEGKSGAEIGRELGISIYTVYNHQAEIKKVKGVRTLTALIAGAGERKGKRRKAS